MGKSHNKPEKEEPTNTTWGNPRIGRKKERPTNTTWEIPEPAGRKKDLQTQQWKSHTKPEKEGPKTQHGEIPEQAKKRGHTNTTWGNPKTGQKKKCPYKSEARAYRSINQQSVTRL